MKTSRIIFLFLLALSVGLGSCKFLEEKGLINKKKIAAELAEKERIEKQRIADSLKLDEEAVRQREMARLDSLERVRQYEEQTKARYKYHVILGSFKLPDNATRYDVVVSNEGFETENLYTRNAFHLVSAMRFDNGRDAWRQVSLFREQGRDAWVYVDE